MTHALAGSPHVEGLLSKRLMVGLGSISTCQKQLRATTDHY
jgi:hypothetical protein